MTMASDIDGERLEQLVGQIIGYITGNLLSFAIELGDELGLYRAMAGAGSVTADEVALATGCHPRLVREWLDGQAGVGLVGYDPDEDAYTLSGEAALVLADDTSTSFLARAMAVFRANHTDFDKVADAYRSDGALSWNDRHPSLFAGTEWFFRIGYRDALPDWIPALDGVANKLTAGGRVADVGCGHGASSVVMAGLYPDSQVYGYDAHPESIEAARDRAADAGVDSNTTFEAADSKSYEGAFDLICFFDAFHDMGDPVGVARYALEHLADDGTVLLVEPFALDGRATNLAENPMAGLLYTSSAVVCIPNSLAQGDGLALGNQAGEEALRNVFADAGFTRFHRAVETPLFLVLEAKA